MLGGAARLNRREALDKSIQRDARFHPAEGHAGAGVNTGPEREMFIPFAADIDPVGIGKFRRVAIGSPDA